MNDDLQPGDIMFTDMDGFVPGFMPVGLGQLALFLTRRWWRMVKSVRAWWHYRHVAIVVERNEAWNTVMICQAMPKGVERVHLGRVRKYSKGTLFIRPNYALTTGHAHIPLTGYRVAIRALAYVGTPYNFLTYVKLAAGAFRFRLTESWLRRKMSTRRDMMCSQHVDQSLADAGFHVFDDGRLPQDVVPAELADALLSLPGWHRFGDGPWIPNTLAPKLR